MQVILKSDVDHLGYAKDVVDVKRGYWRNFLRPRGLAEVANATVIRELADAQERRRSAESRNSAEAEEVKALIDRTSVVVSAFAGEAGKLFGSVTSAEISRVLEATRKLRIDSKKIVLEEPIKTLGTFEVPVDLGHGVKASLTVEVEEAKLTAEQQARMEADRVAEENAREAAELKAAAKAAAGNAPAAAAETDADAEATDAEATGDEAAAPADADTEA
jgi:large subunit ribosomal protein L9